MNLKPQDYLLIGCFLLFVMCILYYYFRKVIPAMKIGKIKLQEEEKQKELEKNKKIFYAIFNFLPGDGSLERHREIQVVFEIIGKLYSSFDEYKNSSESLSYFIAGIFLRKHKIIPDEEVILFVSKEKFSFLKEVNWGVGFLSLKDLENYVDLILSQRKNIFEKSKQVAIALGFEFVEGVIFKKE